MTIGFCLSTKALASNFLINHDTAKTLKESIYKCSINIVSKRIGGIEGLENALNHIDKLNKYQSSLEQLKEISKECASLEELNPSQLSQEEYERAFYQLAKKIWQFH